MQVSEDDDYERNAAGLRVTCGVGLGGGGVGLG